MTPRPRPIHRSRLFWAGVPGLLFLLWVWLFALQSFDLSASDSSSYQLGMRTRPGVIEADLSHFIGAPRGKTTVSAHFSPHLSQDNPFSDGNRFAPAFAGIHAVESVMEGYMINLWRVSIAHWVTVILYLVTWAALLALWQRRKIRLMKQQAAPVGSA